MVLLKGDPSDDEILKYQLWEEQKHKCLYTGTEIGISDFLGSAPKFDIEHTIPRSISLDNSQVNKTLCESKFNESIRKTKFHLNLPTTMKSLHVLNTGKKIWKAWKNK